MTHASVFSGIGGPEVAAAMLGWDNLFHCEINSFGRKILEYWFPKSISYEDITNTDFSEWRGKVDVLTGGFPCQPFSYAGQRRGAQDDRYLWPYMFKCIDQVQPSWVVAENVAGITTMVEQGEVVGVAAQASLFEEDNDIRRYELRETYTLERICNDLGQHGYEVQPILIPACSVGAPHRRDRVFIIAHRIASDTDISADGRDTRAFSRQGEEKGLQERHEVRKPNESSEIRPKGARDVAADTEHQRQAWSEHEGQPRPEEGIPSRSCGGDGRERTASADSFGGGEGTSGEGGGIKGNRSNTNQQQSKRRAETKWSDRFYAILRNATDSSCERLERQDESRSSEGGQRMHLRGDSTRCSGKTLSHTDSHRGREVDEHMESKFADGAEPVGNGWERIVADTSCERPQTGHSRREISEENRNTSNRDTRSDSKFSNTESTVCGEHWQNFPSVSPVHRGNDGLPFNVDNLTISFGKWRTESLKAYGNAIVPQVMYEIFRAIEIVSHQNEI